MKDSRFGFLTLLTTFVLLTVEPSFAATGGSFYPSQLSSITGANTSYGNTNGSTLNYATAFPLTDALDLQAGQWPNSMAFLYNTVADQPTFMEWDLPSGTFDAKTVLAYRNTTYTGFSTGSPWHLELFDGSTWKQIGVGGAGANGDGTIAMGNSSIFTGTKIRAIYDHLNFAGNYFASMGELVVLPDELHKVTNSYTATASSQYAAAYAPSFGIDNQLGGAYSWFSAPGDSNAWYTLSFGGSARVDALLLSKWDNSGAAYTDAIVDIYVNGTLAGGWTNGTKVAGAVDMVSSASYGSFNVFKFDSPLTGVNDLTLKFLNGGRSTDGGQGLGEIIPFTIPEPSAMLLLGLGSVLLLRRHKAKV